MAEDQRSAWRARGHTEIQNARTGQILPLYTDVLDDIEQNAETLDIEAAAARIRVPWLIIHGTEDESVRFQPKPKSSRRPAASRRPDCWLSSAAAIPSGQRTPWRSATPELDTVFNATLEWLAANLQ